MTKIGKSYFDNIKSGSRSIFIGLKWGVFYYPHCKYLSKGPFTLSLQCKSSAESKTMQSY